MCGPSIAQYMLEHGYVDEAGAQAILSGNLGVHPTFLYESLWNLAGLVIVYFLGKKRKFDGQCFLFYFFWYGLGRAWIEGLRTDSLYFFGLELFGTPIRTSQMLAVVSALVAGVALIWMWRRSLRQPKELYVYRLAAQQAEEAGDAPEVASEIQSEHPSDEEQRPPEDDTEEE